MSIYLNILKMPEIELYKKIKKSSEEYAKKKGLKLNPDLKRREWVFKGLVEKKKKLGEFYCPCRVITGNKLEDRKKICPCYWHLAEIKEQGHCLCGLFFKKN